MRTLLFVHGTGTRETGETVAEIAERAERLLPRPARVVSVDWGKAVGPTDEPVAPALPPEYSDRAATDAVPVDSEAALWALLVADPLVELELAATTPAAAPAALAPGEDVPGVAFVGTLHTLPPPAAELARAGLDEAAFARARAAVAADPRLGQVATADTGAAADIAARAIVASMLAARRSDPPAAAYDAAARDALVLTIATSLAAGVGARGFFLDRAMRLAAKLGVATRGWYMDPLTDFVRDVAFYLVHGATVRDEIAAAIRAHAADGPVVVIGHSLGGIACVDLLSDQDVTPPLPVELLVTCGSQAPLLYLMDALHAMSVREPDKARPFSPWLNLYNREDLLSFCAERVFAHTGRDIKDVAVDARVPFPEAHGAYWVQDVLYDEIAKRLR